MKSLLLTLGLFASLPLIAQVDPEDIAFREIVKIRKKIQVLASSEQHCAHDQQCLILPVGHQYCGFPVEHVSASSRSSSFRELASLAQKSQELEADYQRLYGRDDYGCNIPKVMKAACVQYRCVIK